MLYVIMESDFDNIKQWVMENNGYQPSQNNVTQSYTRCMSCGTQRGFIHLFIQEKQ